MPTYIEKDEEHLKYTIDSKDDIITNIYAESKIVTY